MADSTQQMDQPRATLPEEGSAFGAYTIDRQIGRGGFARIYRAHTADGEVRAVKVLMPQMPPPNLYSDELVARFEREARVLQGVRSPHTVQLFEFGRSADGLLYMAFEYLEGQTVSQLLLDGPLPAPLVSIVVTQLLRALQAVHDAGLLHRDLKPSNIMICRIGADPHHVKLIDFGIAKAYDAPRTNVSIHDLTAKGEAIGTPRYMAPEQILGSPCGPSTDLYSLACVVVEMLTGERLVAGDDPVAIVRRHLDNEPLEIPPDVEISPELRDVLTRMLSRNPEQRPQRASDVLAVLPSANPPPPAPPRTEAPRVAPTAAVMLRDVEHARGPGMLRILAVVLAAVLVFVTVVALPWWTVPFSAAALLFTAMRL